MEAAEEPSVEGPDVEESEQVEEARDKSSSRLLDEEPKLASNESTGCEATIESRRNVWLLRLVSELSSIMLCFRI